MTKKHHCYDVPIYDMLQKTFNLTNIRYNKDCVLDILITSCC